MIIKLYNKASRKIRYLRNKKYIPKNPMHDDIYLVEFPKSGITWLSFILANTEIQIHNKQEFITFYNYHKYIADIHQSKGTLINRNFRHTFIKSHSEFNSYYYFVIYLIRNPFDVMVSYYNFMLDLGYKNSFENFVKSSEYGVKKWKRHLTSWLNRDVSAHRIHLLKYEDLLKDTKTSVRKIFINLGLDINDDILDVAVKQSTLEHMVASEKHYSKFNPSYTMSFVGKSHKLKKSDLMTEKIYRYIRNKTKDELFKFYPELLENHNR